MFQISLHFGPVDVLSSYNKQEALEVTCKIANDNFNVLCSYLDKFIVFSYSMKKSINVMPMYLYRTNSTQ